jgi:hypothetical protein
MKIYWEDRKNKIINEDRLQKANQQKKRRKKNRNGKTVRKKEEEGSEE